MIFVTVGAQMPFDRLVKAVDEWAGRRDRRDVLAQVGDSDYRPRHIQAVARMTPAEYSSRMQAADVVVGHAGMGTIITAVQLGKPLLVMPRRGALQETRNDHQVATAQRFRDRGWLRVAMDDVELETMLDGIDAIPACGKIGATASEDLLTAIREFCIRDAR